MTEIYYRINYTRVDSSMTRRQETTIINTTPEQYRKDFSDYQAKQWHAPSANVPWIEINSAHPITKEEYQQSFKR